MILITDGGRAFKMGKYEVTFAQWDACVADGGCGGYTPDDEEWGRGNRPVMNVSWDDAQLFIDWLNGKTTGGYRLPTSGEWSRAASGGATTDESQICRYANHDDDSSGAILRNKKCSDGEKYTAEVGRYLPNDYGLYDMLGNVFEWAQDCGDNEGEDCGKRVIRSSSFKTYVGSIRPYLTSLISGSKRRDWLGFRWQGTRKT